jgi:hypothetical protein
VDRFEPKSVIVAGRRNLIVKLARVCRFVCVLFLAALVVGPAIGREIQRPGAPAVARGLPFAIADFDGDLNPDLARVEVGSSDSTRSVYSIQFQLTTVGRQSIRLVAPVGGLQLLARDVNGDHAIDLVVMTAGLGQPVAVFLNDGHGGFSQGDKNVFPGAFGNSAQNNIASPSGRLEDDVGFPPQTRVGISPQAQLRLGLSLDASAVVPTGLGFPLRPSLISGPSRAPPAAPSI